MSPQRKDDVLSTVRRAVYRRALLQLRASVQAATPEQLMDAVAEPTATGSIARLVSASPGVATGAAGEWAEELLRGADAKQELIAEAGGTLSTGEVARVLGISAPAVQQRRVRRTLLAVPLPNGEWGFPACQFTDAGVARGIPRVLSAFGTEDPWVQLSILLARDESLGGARYIDLLRDDRSVGEVERVARSYGSQGPA